MPAVEVPGSADYLMRPPPQCEVMRLQAAQIRLAQARAAVQAEAGAAEDAARKAVRELEAAAEHGQDRPTHHWARYRGIPIALAT